MANKYDSNRQLNTEELPNNPDYPGTMELFTNPDIDEARQYFRSSKTYKKFDKRTTVKEAVAKYINNGDYIATGGFGTNRFPSSVLHEIVRQRKKDLGLSAHTATHDFQLLIAGNCINRCDIAYAVGLEARGLSKIARKAIESGSIKTTEWSNASLAWRYKAASMGLSFIPTRSMLGTDTAKYSAAKQIKCPFTGKTFLALPALFPDVGVIHVHRADIYGNCQIDGIVVSDFDLARASKRLIITTERFIPEEQIRLKPESTIIPYFLVDAVIEVPYGSYPGNMAYEYFSDEEHLKEWLKAEQDQEVFEEFLQRNIYQVNNFNEYLNLNGGLERLTELRNLEIILD